MPVKPNEQVVQLYQESKRIHPKMAKGKFANWRILVILATQFVFYIVPWINWNGRQAILFDIPGRHFYLFGLTLVPADLIYLTGLLLLSAFGLFWWTTIAGRLWCGYACPQTVYTEIMLWIDHLVEGDRNKRLKLDKSPWNATKIRIKLTKYLLIFVVCAWTGISFAGWFTPIRQLVPNLFHFHVSGAVLFAIAFYGFVTFFMGHIMREQVCKYMCPYARFQSAMFDEDTLIISYDTERGEPRGIHKKNLTAEQLASMGDCVDCTLCVQVCPVGIDIRNGLQYECIGCAACIDACDEVMDKTGFPRGLIRYTTEAALEKKYPESHIKNRLLRPRVLGYGAVLLVVFSVLVTSLVTRNTLRVDIIKDRGVMVRENKEGMLENLYNLRIISASDDTQILQPAVSGFETIKLTGVPENGIVVPAGVTMTVPVQVATYPEYADKGSHPIEFTFNYWKKGEETEKVRSITEKASFIGE
ncbi:cytochrome c oxidase accessory protein CcoG [Stenoxybacter acetivorans]|uniref:cytochrome c oxidase accessory protein CcoG n=1 Tax=Stenoxybacter acetivorans TaxID=422441 RepID=UPI00056031D8|nr:cytochrome c oxidase accessory protein CcoG [Stenoxybacter acetivorans]